MRTRVGTEVGALEGSWLGLLVRGCRGLRVGLGDGSGLGWGEVSIRVGILVGTPDGALVGCWLGLLVRSRVVGSSVGSWLGCLVRIEG